MDATAGASAHAGAPFALSPVRANALAALALYALVVAIAAVRWPPQSLAGAAFFAIGVPFVARALARPAVHGAAPTRRARRAAAFTAAACAAETAAFAAFMVAAPLIASASRAPGPSMASAPYALLLIPAAWAFAREALDPVPSRAHRLREAALSLGFLALAALVAVLFLSIHTGPA